MKRLLCLVVVLLFVVGMASAQKFSPAIVQHQNSAVGHISIHSMAAPQQPTYCSPCFFYGGDGNPNSPNANGLWDNNADYFGIAAQDYTPFLVKKVKGVHGRHLSVSGVGGNQEMYPNNIINGTDPVIADVPWAIMTGVATGGTPATATTVCSGDDAAPTVTATGRLFFGFYEEYNVAAATGGGCTLTLSHKGTMYWQVNPVHTTTFQLAYESNVSDWPTFPNAFGPQEPSDLSYFYGPAFGFSTFANANTQGYFHAFSADIEGTVSK